MAAVMVAERRSPRRAKEARARKARWLQHERDREWEKSMARLREIILRDRPRGGSW